MALTPGSDNTEQSNDHRKSGLFTGVVVILLTVAAAVSSIYAVKAWWFPPRASAEAAGVDSLINVFMVITFVALILVHVVLAWFLIRFAAHGKGRAVYWHESKSLELAWTVVPATILIIITIFSGATWFSLRINPTVAAQENPVRVSLTAAQFAWFTQYPGEDGVLGIAHSDFVDTRNPAGIDPDDPAGKDDFVLTNELVFPVDRPVHIELRARDVLHSFFVPDFRLKQDAVPGRVIDVHFLPTKIGEYEVVCAELCGTGHYIMKATLRVVSEEDYNAWLEEQHAKVRAELAEL